MPVQSLAKSKPCWAKVQEEPLSLAELYRRHVQAVARWARRLGGPGIEVEDVVQEVFLVAHRKLAAFRGESSPATWLYRITENVTRHRRRKERWRRWLSGSAEETAGPAPSAQGTPHEALEQRQRERALYQALEGMKEKYRRVLILFELEELSGEEIAELEGAKTATVWVWLHRARAELVRRLEAMEQREVGR